jgi:Xaa-Pro aminopeptidase
VNWDALYTEMDRQGLDAVVGADPQSVFYLTGSYIDCNIMFWERLAFVVVPRKGESTFIVCNIEEAVVKTVSWVDDVQTYAQYIESAAKLAQVLKDKGLGGKRIGMEEQFVSTKLYDRIAEQLPDAELLSGDGAIAYARARKMPVEVEALEATAHLADRATQSAWKAYRAGMTEYDVASKMTLEMHGQGGNRVDHIYVGAGENSQVSRHKPGDKTLEPGEIVVSEFGVVRNQYGSGSGYWSDLARMGVVGSPSPHQTDLYALLRRAHLELVDRMRPGARCNELWAGARDGLMSGGVDEVLPHAGHSMPRSRAYEGPVIEPTDTTKLESGMVFAVGPSFRAGAERYQIRDVIAITDSTPRLLSSVWDTSALYELQ